MPCATLREMLEAGVHFGHQTRFWNPSMAPYIFGERNKIHIINLEVTQRLLDEAADQLRQWAAQGKTILVVGTKRAAQDIVKAKAEECGMPYVSQRWLGGTLTNFHTVRNSLKRLQDLKRMEEESLLARVSKKEALRLTREKLKLERSLGGIEAMEKLPDVLFVIDVRYERIAVREARRLDIPVVAVVDSNSSIEGIDCIIPGNDDAIRSIRLYMDIISKAIQEGREEAKEADLLPEPTTREPAIRRKGRRLQLSVEGEKDATTEEGDAAGPVDAVAVAEPTEKAEAGETSQEAAPAEAEAESGTDTEAQADAAQSDAEEQAEPEEAPEETATAEAETELQGQADDPAADEEDAKAKS